MRRFWKPPRGSTENTLPRKSHLRTAEITVWDEAPEVVGWRVEAQPMENQVTISEQLVSEGNERADREQRMAAGWGAL